MENQKKTYLKPAIRVEEWDFNEAVCLNQAAMCSPRNMCIKIDNGESADFVKSRGDFEGSGDTSSWNKFPQ